MKTRKHLFPKVFEYENLLLAHENARRGKRNNSEIVKFHEKHETYLLDLKDEISSGTWRPDPYREFVQIGLVKRRVIHAPTYRDRVVHHAIAQVILPVLEPGWIYDSYACRQGKGSHRAVKRLQSFLRKCNEPNPYVLQLDISKYYPSIHHGVLLERLSQRIADDGLLSMVERLLYGFSMTGRGIPIGAYTSQIFANVYLDILDHFAKECLCEHFYVRYMDDVVIVGRKTHLQEIAGEIRWMVEGPLRLKLNPKSKLFPASRGTDFCGYRTWRYKMRPRKRTVKAARRRFERISARARQHKIPFSEVKGSVTSFLGYMGHCNGRRTAASALARLKIPKGGITWDTQR